MNGGFILAAPSSNAGKTTVTLALLRALKRSGLSVSPAKSGPDYIDPRFHEIASGRSSVNLDPWAMRENLVHTLAARQADTDLLVIEGVMGLFDGASGGQGATAQLATILKLPVILVLDIKGQAQSAAAVAQGFRYFRDDVEVAGVILNRVGSDRHLSLLQEAFDEIDLPVIGVLRHDPVLSLPSRHLGLVQAMELTELDALIDRAADNLAISLDLEKLQAISGQLTNFPQAASLVPLGQRIAIAHDEAFAFAYPHMMQGWSDVGAELSFFSPLNDEAPASTVDAIFLPGGYPELHGGRLASASVFKESMQAAANRNTLIYGECGGYMTLGKTIVDADGTGHAMLDLLPLETSFEKQRLHLGYRRLTPLSPVLPWQGRLRAHEFHYATILHEGEADRLFGVEDAEGTDKPPMGLWAGSVTGSFAHLIDCENG